MFAAAQGGTELKTLQNIPSFTKKQNSLPPHGFCHSPLAQQHSWAAETTPQAARPPAECCTYLLGTDA